MTEGCWMVGIIMLEYVGIWCDGIFLYLSYLHDDSFVLHIGQVLNALVAKLFYTSLLLFREVVENIEMNPLDPLDAQKQVKHCPCLPNPGPATLRVSTPPGRFTGSVCLGAQGRTSRQQQRAQANSGLADGHPASWMGSNPLKLGQNQYIFREEPW